MREKIIGLGSGQSMFCRLCGYRGNSYYHVACSGGNCHLCGKAHSYNICEQCDKVMCKEHMVKEHFGMVLCGKCSAKYRGDKFKKPKPTQACDCIYCERERRQQKELDSIK